MEKFKKFFGTTYFYTDNKETLPANVSKHIDSKLGINYSTEKFICAGWLKGLFSVPYFFIVTDKRIAVQLLTRLEQNSFKDVTGIEQDIYKNIKISAAGNPTVLFLKNRVPSKELLAKLIPKLNAAWLDSKSNTGSAPKQDVDVIGQIEKLSKLKDSGVLSEAEYDAKKKELLAKL